MKISYAVVCLLAAGLAASPMIGEAASYKVVDIGSLDGNNVGGTAINASGWVTGSASTTSGYDHAFLWNGSSMQDLGGISSNGFAINASGWVTGNFLMPGFADPHAFLWNGSSMQDLGTLGGTTSWAFGINSNGWVSGTSITTNNAASRA